VLGVHGKLVKYVVHSSKRKKKIKKKISSQKLPKQQSTNFWSQGILGVNIVLIVCFMQGLNMLLYTKAKHQHISIVQKVT
jgi:hypothetical protein